jgi:nucleoid-associated protein YgaU
MRQALVLLGAAGLLTLGCQNKNKNQPAASITDEPAGATYTSLDSMNNAGGAAPGFAANTGSTYAPPGSTLESSTPAGAGTTGGDESLMPADGSGRVHTVQKGDTLMALARRFYQDQSKWKLIWEANRARLSDPNRLQVGMKLIIP